MDELEKIKKNKMEQLKKGEGKPDRVKIKVSDSDFSEKVIDRSDEVPVVVDFWAEWCQPCKIIGPRLEKLAKEYGGRFILAKLNVDQNEKTESKHRIRGIPTIKMFNNGEIVDKLTGATSESQIRNWLDKNLS